MKTLRLAEITGPYGPVSISERVLQKIWWTGDCIQEGLRTLSGKTLRLINPGDWNHFEGPDFTGALIELDGRPVHGDIEAHFYAEDWRAHGHHNDPAYDKVVLHLLLFPPRGTQPEYTHSGRPLETLVLLPFLSEDIEDCVNSDALHALESREQTRWQEILDAHPAGSRHRLLQEKAAARWSQKVRFARHRLAAHGWRESCHQLALETLGLRRNRAPMTALSLRHPLDAMRDATAGALFEEQRGQWRLAGNRPPNHPRRRLEQYLSLLSARPDWPEGVKKWGETLSSTTSIAHTHDSARFRKSTRFSAMARHLRENTLAGTIGGTRFHTLVCDALLPLLAAQSGGDGEATPLEGYARHWYHWPVGDVPSKLITHLHAQLPPEYIPAPVIGNGLFQGLLQLSHENG
ncbi:MAG: DUF2851 family protein [Puniceicoccales bacterium]|nr:DUF2851 family protein [Puniceicoccales bacterium]